MKLAELSKVATDMVGAAAAVSRSRRIVGHDQDSLRPDGVESTADTRRDYSRNVFRAQTRAMSKHISGVILYDGPSGRKSQGGTPMVKVSEKAGSLPRHQKSTGGAAARDVPERGHPPRASKAWPEAYRIPPGLGAKSPRARRDRHRRGHPS